MSTKTLTRALTALLISSSILLGSAGVALAATSGNGTMTVSPNTTPASTAGQTFTFTFTHNGSSGFSSNSQMSLVVPAGWTAPQNSLSTNPGFVSISSTGTCGASIASITGSGPWTITVNQTCSVNNTITLVYGAGTSVAKVTSPASCSPGGATCTFTTATKNNPGSLTSIASSPTITIITPTTTVGDGTSPSNKSLNGSDVNQAISEFALSTNVGTDTVTGLVVTGTNTANVAASGVKIYQDVNSNNEWDAGDTLKGTASFVGTTATFSGLSIGVTTTSTKYLVTYDTVASPINGQTLTAFISGVTATNTTANSDNADATITIDTSAPTLAQVTAVPSPTNDTSPNYTFSSSETGTITYGGDCSSADTTAASGNNTQTFNTLSAGTHSNCTITVTDAAGNVSAPLSVNTFTIDTTVPTVAITQAAGQTDPTSTGPINFTATFSEPVNNFTSADITTGGTAGGTKTATVTGTGPYNISVTGMTTSGTVTVTIAANAAQDLAGNNNTASTNTDNSVTWAPVAGDGTGTMTVTPTTVAQNITGYNLPFSFINNTNGDFTAGSIVELTIPAGWSAPQTSNVGGTGYVTVEDVGGTGCEPGAATISGAGPWTIDVPQTCTSGQTVIVHYNNVTAPAATGVATFTTLSQDGPSGLTPIAASPTITVIPSYSILSSATAGGSITPSGITTVTQGSSQTYSMVPNATYIVAAPTVDGVGQSTRAQNFAFSNVTTNHSIVANFDGGWNAPTVSPSSSGLASAASGAYTSNDTYANFDNGGDVADYNNFNITIPAGATINGIEVAIEGFRDSGSTRSFDVSLSSNGSAGSPTFTATKNANGWTQSDRTILIGGSADLWGRTWTAADLTNTNFRLKITSTSGGNTIHLDQISVKVHYTADTTAPAGGAVSYTDGYYTTASVPVTYTLGTDTGAGLNTASGKLQRASAPLAAGVCGTFTPFSDLATEFDGSYTDASVTNGNCYQYQYIISDLAGTPNTATYTSVNVVKVDTQKPTTTIDAALDGNGHAVLIPSGTVTNSNSIGISFSGTDAESGVASFECKLDADAYVLCTSIKTYSGLTDGVHTILVHAFDVAGNVENTASISWTADTTAPVVTVPTDITTEATSGAGAAVSFVTSALDALDGAVATVCAPVSGSTFVLGTTPVNCSATDAVGNVGSASFNVIVTDTTAPVITLNGNATINVVYGVGYVDEGATALDTYDGAVTATASGDTVDTTTIPGTYHINYDAVDAASNHAVTVVRTIVVAKAPLSVAADNATKVYGTANPTFTGVVTGVLNSDVVSASYSSVADNTSPVGDYAIVPELSGAGLANYDAPTITNGTLSVTKANAVIVVTPYAGIYDGAPHGVTGTATGALGEDLSSLLDLGATFTDVPGGPVNWTFAGDANHNATGGASSVNISPRTAVCTIVGATTPYDAVAHGASGTCLGANDVVLTGLDLGDSFTNVPGGTAHWTFGRNNYIQQSGDVSIDITKVAPTVTVTPYAVTFDNAPHTATGSVTGVLGESLSGLDLSGTTHTAAGTYAADPWAFIDITGNYSDASGTVSDTIESAGSVTTVTCPNPTEVYTGSAVAPCTATVTGVGGLNQSVTVNYSANINTGTVTATATFAGDNDHQTSSGSTTFDIVVAPSVTTVTCPNLTETYTGSAIAPCSAVVTGAGVLNEPVDVTYSPNTDVGTVTATATYAGDANHAGSSDTETFDIVKADSTTTITCPVSAVYTGVAQTPCTATITGVGGLNESVIVDHTNNTNVGIANASATFLGDANHAGSSDAKTFAITPAAVTITVTPYSTTYSGAAHTATVVATGALGEDLTAGVDLSGTTHTNAGDYATDAWTFHDSAGNYADTQGTVHDVIAKATATIVVTGYSIPFDGTEHLATGTATGVLAEPLSGLDLSATAHTAAGTYATDAWTFAGDSNYNTDSGTVSDTISAATATIVVSGGTFTYDNTAHAATGFAYGVGGIAGELTPALTFTYSGSGTTVYGPTNVAPTDAGTYDVLANFAGNTNYSAATAPATITITKAPSTTDVVCTTPHIYTGVAIEPCTVTVMGVNLSLTPSPVYADNIVVGTASATYTFGGDSNHDGSTDTDTFTITGADSTTVVTCPASAVFTGSAIEPCTATVTGAGGFTDTVPVVYLANTDVGTATANATFAGDANHTTSNGTATFGITPKALTVTANSGQSKVFGAVEPALTYTPSEAVTFTGALHRATGENVGVYAIDQGTLSAGTNYTISFVPDNFAITPAGAQVNVNGYSGAYDAIAHGVTGTATDGATDLSSMLTLGATYTNVPGGTAHWTFHDPAHNYADQSGDVAITITKATPTVAVTPYTVGYDGNAHVASGTATGVLSEALTGLVLTGTTHTVVGDYPTDAWTFTDATGNYNNVSGSVHDAITATSATVAISSTAQTYDGTPKSVDTATTPVGLTVDTTYDGSATIPTNAGTYAVVATINDANYNGTNSDTLVIAKAAQTIAFAALSGKSLGAADFAVAASGGGSGNPVTFGTLSTACTVSADGTVVHLVSAGTCDIAADQAGNANYTAAATVHQAFTISSGTATVAISNTSQTYDGSPKSVTTTTTPTGLTVDVTYDGSATAPTNAGSYAVVGTIADLNYTGTNSGTLVIAKVSVAVTADNQIITVGDADPAFTFTYGAFQGTDTSVGIDTAPVCSVTGTHTAVGTYPITCSGGVDNNYTFNYTAGTLTVSDLPAPVITAEAASSATATSITVTWTTDHPATSRVVYDTVSHSVAGTPVNYGYAFSTTEDATLSLTHSVTITPLVSGTTYYFRAVSHGSPEAISNEITGTTLVPVPTLGTVTVTKVVVGNSNYTVGDFPLFVGDTSVVSGVATQFAPATYSIHETSNINFTPTYSGSCVADASNAARLASIQDFKDKNLALQNAILAAPGDTVGNADKTAHIADNNDKILALLNALGASVTVGAGQSANCTITNTFVPPPTDVCPDDVGVQTDVAQCTVPPVDVCPNDDGVQTSVDQCTVVPPPPTTATVVATKIVCDNEDSLPNWGMGAADITASTAATFLASHPECHPQAGWTFQWAPDGTVNPGDNYGVAGAPWSTVGVTDATGVASSTIPATASDKLTWLREVMQTGYLTFTGWLYDSVHPATVDDAASPEMYCNNDVLNYDNYDYIKGAQAGATYYCVAFNVHLPTTGNIVVDKITNPSEDPTIFHFVASYDPDGGFDLSDTSEPQDTAVEPGTYSLSEDPTEGWSLSSAVCTNDDGDAVDPAHITIAANETVSCVFTNTKDQEQPEDGKLVVIKKTKGGNASFDFNGGVLGDFSINTHHQVGMKVFKHVPVGEYSIDEGTKEGWTNTKNSCDNVTVTAGHTTFCIVVNKKVTHHDGDGDGGGHGDDGDHDGHGGGGNPSTGTIVIKKVTVGGTGTFTFTTNYSAPFNLAGGQTSTTTEFAGNKMVAEGAMSGWTQTSATCVSSKGDTEVPANMSLQASETITCTFVNTKDTPPVDTGSGDTNTGGGSGGGNTPPVTPPAPAAPVAPTALGGGPIGGGSVLGASTAGQVLGASCGLYMEKHLKIGSAKNDKDQVTKLQTFLNKYGFGKFDSTGYFGPKTLAAIKAFQAKYKDDVLKPWDIDAPTGLVYLSTLHKINSLECPELTAELPALVPWSANPHAQ